MIVFLIKENKKYYDIETMRQILNVSKSKIQRQLKKQDNEVVKYKNLHLYNEHTLFNLMEIILIEKLEKIDD
ncbi:hypothetical protein OA93_04670 [Flavobacterium sp. KMS]|nr:hypothetical protein OA93_04670 [Flavobacterium sp. KMS]